MLKTTPLRIMSKIAITYNKLRKFNSKKIDIETTFAYN